MSDARPIGVFDSGVGGLTVLRELHRQLPGEELVYIADLLHFPYGPRSLAEVRAYALRIISHLVGFDTKLVVIGCNTATAAALNAAREVFDVPIVGVIAPGAQAAVETTSNSRVAVISTLGTHESQEYVHALREANPGVAVLSKPAPDLVRIVEDGMADTPRADASLQAVLEEILEWGADTLVLGCTHYPLLKPALRRVVGDKLSIVDSAQTTAAKVLRVLKVNRLESGTVVAGRLRLLVTAQPQQFLSVARRLFGDDLEAPSITDPWSDVTTAPVAS